MSDIASGIGSAFSSGPTGSVISPAMSKLTQKFNQLYEPSIPSPVEASILRRREKISMVDYLLICSRHGYPEELAEKMHELTKLYPQAIDYIVLWRRGKITEGELQQQLYKLGWESEEINRLKELTVYYPGPQDLISFAVREVFSPEKLKAMGADTTPPKAFLDEAEKVGITGDVAKWYWWAHWRLPSMTQVWDMYHRRDGSQDKGVIDDQLLDTYLESADVMPGWRPYLKKISYSPYTRVDIRRMFAMGIIDRDRVKMSYMDIGYDDEHAENLTKFTEREYTSDLAGISKSKVLSSYKKGIIDRPTAVDMLKKLNLSEASIIFDLQLADWDIAEQQFELVKDEVETLYWIGQYTLADVRDHLSSINAPSSFTEKVIGELSLASAKKRKVPSKTDLARWLDDNVIDQDDYFTWMNRIGYAQEVAQLYMTEIIHNGGGQKRKFLTTAQYRKWLQSGIMNEAQFRQTLSLMGVAEMDINRYVQEVSKGGK